MKTLTKVIVIWMIAALVTAAGVFPGVTEIWAGQAGSYNERYSEQVLYTHDTDVIGESPNGDIHSHGFFGCEAKGGSAWTIVPYKLNSDDVKCGEYVIYDVTDGKKVSVQSGDCDYGKAFSFNKGVNGHTYVCDVNYTYNKTEYSTENGMVVKDNVYKPAVMGYDKNKVDDFYALIKKSGIKPSECLSLDDLTYPSHSDMTVQRDEWIKEFDTYVANTFKGRAVPDDYKLMGFCKYIINNYYFDRWRVNSEHSRAWYNDHTNPNDYMLKNKCGVCWDFTNILVIVARHLGIPATSMDTDDHTYCIVYYNDEWLAIDITPLMEKENMGETPLKMTRETTTMRWSEVFMYPRRDNNVESIGQSIMTDNYLNGDPDPQYYRPLK